MHVPQGANRGLGIVEISERSAWSRKRSRVSLLCSCKTLNASGAPSVDSVSFTTSESRLSPSVESGATEEDTKALWTWRFTEAYILDTSISG